MLIIIEKQKVNNKGSGIIVKLYFRYIDTYVRYIR